MKVWEFLSVNSWTQRSLARDIQGRMVYETDPTACSFCMMGAILKVHGRESASAINAAMEIKTFLRETIEEGKTDDYPEIFWNLNILKLERQKERLGISYYNDLAGVTHHHVVALLRHLDI